MSQTVSGVSEPVAATSLLVSAVEISGDLLAAELLASLRHLVSFQARGIAGPAMRAQGVEALMDIEAMSANGLVEVLARYPEIRRAGRLLEGALGGGPSLLLCIDGPDFHRSIARKARDRGICTVGYVAPQVWAWRPGRARGLGESFDHLLCLFPFEVPLFKEHGLDARWVGHPAVDRVKGLRCSPERDCFALLPGSRPHEIKSLLPVFLETARVIRRARPEARFLVGAAPGVEMGRGLLPDEGFERVEGLQAAAIRAEAALVASGTATLELALIGLPMVVAYAVNPLTLLVGRALVKGIRHIALPNILARRQVVPEFIQDLRPEELARSLLDVAARPPALMTGLREVRELLGPPGASERAAALVAGWMREPLSSGSARAVLG